MNSFPNRTAQRRVLAALAPQNILIHHRNHYGVEMVVVDIFSQVAGRGLVDFVCVHNSSHYIL